MTTSPSDARRRLLHRRAMWEAAGWSLWLACCLICANGIGVALGLWDYPQFITTLVRCLLM